MSANKSLNTPQHRKRIPCARCGRLMTTGGRNHNLGVAACRDCRDTDPEYCSTLLGFEVTTPPAKDPGSHSHGVSGYNNHGCRCDTCRAAKADAKARERAKKDTHGLSRYKRQGCRCDICREANRQKGIRQRAAKRAEKEAA